MGLPGDIYSMSVGLSDNKLLLSRNHWYILLTVDSSHRNTSPTISSGHIAIPPAKPAKPLTRPPSPQHRPVGGDDATSKLNLMDTKAVAQTVVLYTRCMYQDGIGSRFEIVNLGSHSFVRQRRFHLPSSQRPLLEVKATERESIEREGWVSPVSKSALPTASHTRTHTHIAQMQERRRQRSQRLDNSRGKGLDRISHTQFMHNRGNHKSGPLRAGEELRIATRTPASSLPSNTLNSTGDPGNTSTASYVKPRPPTLPDKPVTSVLSRSSSLSSTFIHRDRDEQPEKRQKIGPSVFKGENPFSAFVQSQAFRPLPEDSGYESEPLRASDALSISKPGPSGHITAGSCDGETASRVHLLASSSPANIPFPQSSAVPHGPSTPSNKFPTVRSPQSARLRNSIAPTRLENPTPPSRPSSLLSKGSTSTTGRNDSRPNFASLIEAKPAESLQQPQPLRSGSTAPVELESARFKASISSTKRRSLEHSLPSKPPVPSFPRLHGRVSENARPNVFHNQAPQPSLLPNPTVWSDEPSSVPGNPRRPTKQFKHPRLLATKQGTASVRPFHRGRVQRPTIIKPSPLRPQPIAIPTVTSLQELPAQTQASSPPLASSEGPRAQPGTLDVSMHRRGHLLPKRPSLTTFDPSPEATATQAEEVPSPLPERSTLGEPVSVRTQSLDAHSSHLTTRHECFRGNRNVEPDIAARPFPSQSSIGRSITPSLPTFKVKNEETTGASMALKVKTELANASSRLALQDASGDDELPRPTFGKPVELVKVKREKPEPTEVVLPQRRLVTQSCSFYPILDNCRKSVPGYKENRVAFFRKEYKRLQSFGLKKHKVVFRDDGLAIEWSTPIPVWSDTLLPEPAT
ncbi:hypothetical protein D9756_002742 [Leucocoprinus leucothites]|uniref:Uncharacterized protein n=1 Tax=Leucocoprinus leucothites TaxID=201217 RepID=A0A8H5LLK3_9AGAR|nr:hypothetical protein D9756_002742 [Leucoagaricus leucothites]